VERNHAKVDRRAQHRRCHRRLSTWCGTILSLVEGSSSGCAISMRRGRRTSKADIPSNASWPSPSSQEAAHGPQGVSTRTAIAGEPLMGPDDHDAGFGSSDRGRPLREALGVTGSKGGKAAQGAPPGGDRV